MFTLQKMCPITSVDSYYDMYRDKFLLLIADEMGYVRIQDISSILEEFPGLRPVDVVKDNVKRNPWRVLAIDKAESGFSDFNDAGSDNSSNFDATENDVEPILKEFQFVQIAQWQAHKDVIRTVKYISETDIPIIFTASMDKMARIWTYSKDKIENLGTLRQGYMLKEVYNWNFPLSHYH